VEAYRHRHFIPKTITAGALRAALRAARQEIGDPENVSDEGTSLQEDSGQVGGAILRSGGTVLVYSVFLDAGEVLSASVSARTWESAGDFLDRLQAALQLSPLPRTDPQAGAVLRRLRAVLDGFHGCVMILSRRAENRIRFEIRDEVDVQDLLHALFTVVCDDVRREEATPSFAGKFSRADFFIRADGVVIEVKLAREGRGAKQIGDELIVDLVRYRQLASVKTIICFVYDPDHWIVNRAGFEDDLSGTQEGIRVEVYVRPVG
jgi:hypothetical protein